MTNTVDNATVAPPLFEVTYQPYDSFVLEPSIPLILFVLEGQPDQVINARFPEVEAMRQSIERSSVLPDDRTYFFVLTRDGVQIPVILIYLGRKWLTKRRSRTLRFGTLAFYRTLGVQVAYALKKLRDLRYTEATIILPGRFHPRNLHKDPQGERDEETFVRTTVEWAVTANGVNAYETRPQPTLQALCFVHFGGPEAAATHFFVRTAHNGLQVGAAIAEAARLTTMPPSDKVPRRLVEHIIGNELVCRSTTSAKWRNLGNHRFGPKVKVALMYGAEGLRNAGFRLIAAVGQGSRDEPCLLKLHYRPHVKHEVKKLALIGKGVILDTGGLSLKVDGYMERMHYDMAGAATVASVFRLAVERNLPIEITALIPIVENAIGPNAFRLHDIVRAYDGQTVEITDTDSEGRLILADAIAYSEKHVQPDATVTVATLGDMSDFGPDFLKVLVNGDLLERKVRLAEERSFEKVMLFPKYEHYEDVADGFGGAFSDLRNDPKQHYHAGMLFLSRFFVRDPWPWLFLDVSNVFEENAEEAGAGPGFGVRFLWHFVKQFAH